MRNDVGNERKTQGADLNDAIVSIIVPVFNVKSFLRRCIDSLIGQKYDKLEIILVDDGSADGSGEICDEYQKKDGRVKVIHKANEGLGLTRNVGIKKATGKYILFVDGDDYISRDTVIDSVATIENDSSDIVMFGMNRVSRDGRIRAFVPNPKKCIYDGLDIVDDLLPDFIHDNPRDNIRRNYTSSTCTCLFKRELFTKNSLYYESERDIVSEDTYLMFNMFSYARKISIIKKCYYNYCENVDSLSHGYRKDRFEKLKYYYEICNELFDDHDYPKEAYIRFKYLFLDYVFADFKTIINNRRLRFNAKYSEFKNIICDTMYGNVVRGIQKQYEPLKRRVFYFFATRKMVTACMAIVYVSALRRRN